MVDEINYTHEGYAMIGGCEVTPQAVRNAEPRAIPGYKVRLTGVGPYGADVIVFVPYHLPQGFVEALASLRPMSHEKGDKGNYEYKVDLETTVAVELQHGTFNFLRKKDESPQSDSEEIF